MDSAITVNEANATTLKLIAPAATRDLYFKSSGVLARMRARGREGITPWQGGLYREMPFSYRPLIGGAYPRGGTFDTTKVETMSANRFVPKFYYVNITEFLSDMLIFNTGPSAILNRFAIDMQVAVNTLNEMIILDLWKHGQGNAGGASGNLANRENNTNGLAEAFNDGITTDWQGNVFPVYGNTNRLATGTFGNALNSYPMYVGTSGGQLGSLTYNQLEYAYQQCHIGQMEPDLGVCNRSVFVSIKNRIQPEQRIMQPGVDYIWGVSGIRMNNAVIVMDEYCPSTVDGLDRATGSNLTSSFTAVSGANANSGMPSSGTVNVGGTFWWLNMNKIQGTMPDNLFGFGFTGFQRPLNGDTISGQYLLAFTAWTTDSRTSKCIFGIKETL
jgi:hypothetical protein